MALACKLHQLIAAFRTLRTLVRRMTSVSCCAEALLPPWQSRFAVSSTPVMPPIGSYISCNWCGNGDRKTAPAQHVKTWWCGRLSQLEARCLLTRPERAICERGGHESLVVNQWRLIDGHAGPPAAPAAKKTRYEAPITIRHILSLSASCTDGVSHSPSLSSARRGFVVHAIDDAGVAMGFDAKLRGGPAS
jgi:hypothetical protein